jgi:CO/xanthine dehydrogenase Mo-binding subunit
MWEGITNHYFDHTFTATGVLGRSVARLEDPPLLTGRGVFVGDIGFPHSCTCASCARLMPMPHCAPST